MKLRLFLLLFASYMLIASREPPWGDAHVVYETSSRLVEFGRLDVTLGGPPQFYSIRDGKKYGVFPLGNVIAMVPSWLVYKVVHAIPHQPGVEDLIYRFTSHLSPAALIAGLCVLFFSLCAREGASEKTALFLALMLGTSTILVIYSRVAFSEALQALALTWVIERGLSLGDRLSLRGAFFGGVACGVLFNTKIVYALLLPVVAIYIALQHRRRLPEVAACLGVAAIPLTVLVAIAIAHNYLKTGTLTDTGYRIPEGVFSGDAYAALHGFFLSSGKSVFLYSPPLVLGFIAFPSYLRHKRSHALFLLAVSVAMTLANAKFRYWHADYCWGPRLLVPLTAVWLLPAAHWIDGALRRGKRDLRALGLGALVGSGIFVQLLGGAFYWDHYIRIATAVKDQTGAAGWYTEDLHHCHFIPQFSPLVGHAWMLRHWVHDDANLVADAPWRRVVGSDAANKVNIQSEWAGVKLDFWLRDWRQTPGAERWIAGVLVLVLSTIGLSGLGLARRLRSLAPSKLPASSAQRPSG